MARECGFLGLEDVLQTEFQRFDAKLRNCKPDDRFEGNTARGNVCLVKRGGEEWRMWPEQRRAKMEVRKRDGARVLLGIPMKGEELLSRYCGNGTQITRRLNLEPSSWIVSFYAYEGDRLADGEEKGELAAESNWVHAVEGYRVKLIEHEWRSVAGGEASFCDTAE